MQWSALRGGPKVGDVATDAFLRQRALVGFGEQGQRRLERASVIIVGVGGLGCPVAQSVVSAGVGKVTLVDSDKVATSNLHRQTLYGPDDVGCVKVEVAKSALQRIATVTEITAIGSRISGETADLLAGHDLVFDCTDTWASRRSVSDAAHAAGLPIVWGAVSGWFGQVTVLPPGGHIRDVFPGEPELDLAVCDGGGVFGPLCAQVGAAMAAAGVARLSGSGEPLAGRLSVIDARTGVWRTVDVTGGDS